MKILFITSTRLGDGVLSMGALNYFIEKYPGAKITVICGPVIAGIFEPASGVERVIAMKKERYSLHWYKMWRQTIGTRWDIVIDLRNSPLSRLLVAGKRYIWGSEDKTKHKVEQIASVVEADPPPAPALWFNDDIRNKAAALIPAGSPVLAIGPAANWPAKTWPADHFIALINKLTADGSILPRARVAIFAAPGEEQTAYKVLNALPLERRLDVIAKASPVVAAAALQRCTLYIGNDSGLMHSAAAVGIPTLGLFGPSLPQLYRPWGSRAAYVSTPETFEQLLNHPGYTRGNGVSLMTTLTVDAAYAAAVELWKKIAQ